MKKSKLILSGNIEESRQKQNEKDVVSLYLVVGTANPFKFNSYGLALLDIRMAPLNGFELYKKIKNVDDSLKVCFITAFEDYRQEFKESFAN